MFREEDFKEDATEEDKNVQFQTGGLTTLSSRWWHITNDGFVAGFYYAQLQTMVTQNLCALTYDRARLAWQFAKDDALEACSQFPDIPCRRQPRTVDHFRQNSDI